ncbi:uncharacterized protein NEMAJ01_0762 [Nematocida major]|uniref:uncharacterized protein n=1 Tax=Nematocida major TaxID=1912982 RepID=UPI0020083A40|nr:uncharacterized protein NEMAJ01_0762 [Nematocida major]KAH9385866.1 hypothetical protein NEMAJ01_0762 [Nematocida major]
MQNVLWVLAGLMYAHMCRSSVGKPRVNGEVFPLKIRVIVETLKIPEWKVTQAVEIFQRIYAESGLNVRVECTEVRYAPETRGEERPKEIYSDDTQEIEGIALFNALQTVAEGITEKKNFSGRNQAMFFLHLEESPKVHGASIEGGLFRGSPIAICTITPQDTPKEIGETMAHELAHLLGAKHDGVSNSCHPRGSLMEQVYTKQAEIKRLSPCTKASIKDSIQREIYARER